MCFCWLSACLGGGREAALLLALSGREANPHRQRHGHSRAALAALPEEMQPRARPRAGWPGCSRSGRERFPRQETPSPRGLLQPRALPPLPQGTEASPAANNARMRHRHHGADRAAKFLCLLNPRSLHFGSKVFFQSTGDTYAGSSLLFWRSSPCSSCLCGILSHKP